MLPIYFPGPYWIRLEYPMLGTLDFMQPDHLIMIP